MRTELLTAANITLREMRTEDCNQIHNWENRAELQYLGDTHSPLTKEQVSAFIQRTTGDLYLDEQLRLMIETKDETIGCIDLFDFDSHNKRAGVGILIAEPRNRRKGFAKDALNLLCNYCSEVFNFRQLYCHIPVDNKASLRLFSACQFEKTGHNKDWVKKGNTFVDAIFLQKLLWVD